MKVTKLMKINLTNPFLLMKNNKFRWEIVRKNCRICKKLTKTKILMDLKLKDLILMNKT